MTQPDEKQRQDPIPVAQRITTEREDRGWSVQKLADRCADVGAPQLNRNVLVNLQTGKRRYLSTDELIALALAFDVSPGRLLLPPEPVRTSKPLADQHPGGWPVKLTEKVSAPWEVAQRWMNGEVPPDSPDANAWAPEWIRENRPYEADVLAELQTFLDLRVRTPFKIELERDGAGRWVNAEMVTKSRRSAEEAELWPACGTCGGPNSRTPTATS